MPRPDLPPPPPPPPMRTVRDSGAETYAVAVLVLAGILLAVAIL